MLRGTVFFFFFLNYTKVVCENFCTGGLNSNWFFKKQITKMVTSIYRNLCSAKTSRACLKEIISGFWHHWNLEDNAGIVSLCCSVTIVVAYLMKKHGMRLSQALAHVKCRRPQAAPNYGFISQLQQFEQNLQGASNSLLQS